MATVGRVGASDGSRLTGQEGCGRHADGNMPMPAVWGLPGPCGAFMGRAFLPAATMTSLALRRRCQHPVGDPTG